MKKKNRIQHIGCSKYDKYLIDATGILHKRIIDFNSTFSAKVIPQILIKYLLHASHNLLGHVGATKLYHFLRLLYYFQGMRRKTHQYVRSCNKCQIMNMKKPHFIDLHQDMAQTPQDHVSIYLLAPHNIKSHALTTLCNLTGYPMTTPIKDKK